MNIENLLDNINIIYKRKQYLQKITEPTIPLNKNILKSFNIQYNNINGKIVSKLITGQKYNAIQNNGGGDCFFYSIIDSGIPIIYMV